MRRVASAENSGKVLGQFLAVNLSHSLLIKVLDAWTFRAQTLVIPPSTFGHMLPKQDPKETSNFKRVLEETADSSAMSKSIPIFSLPR